MSDALPRYVDVYLEPLREWLEREDVVEIAINPDGSIWIERLGSASMEMIDKRVTAREAVDLATSLVANTNARVSREQPVVSGKIEYAGQPLRVQVVIAPAVEAGASITIRMFGKSSRALPEPEWLFGQAVSLDDQRIEALLEVQALASHDLKAAMRMIMHKKLNVIVSGGTSSGKTTFTRWLLQSAGEKDRIITIEDAFELFPHQPNTVSLLADRQVGSARTAEALLQASLRMRPDRIVVGELRGREALTFLEAINTGHGGSVTTLHAETANLAIDRLALMVLQAGTPLTFAEIKDYIARSVDVIVQLARTDGKRGVTEMYLPGRQDMNVHSNKGVFAHDLENKNGASPP